MAFYKCIVFSLLLLAFPASAYKVAVLGDSLTFSAKERANVGYPTKLEAILNARTAGNYQVGSYGISNTTSSQHLTTWTNAIRNKGYNCIVILSGVNDAFADTPAATTFSNIDTIVTQALADGLAVVLVTVLPYGAYASWTAPRQALTTTLNTSIRGRSGVLLVDAYPQFETTPGSGVLLVAYEDPDHLHLLTAGSDALASRVAAVIP